MGVDSLNPHQILSPSTRRIYLGGINSVQKADLVTAPR
jgi:hypothetical protein